MTLGTATGFGPDETLIRTEEPGDDDDARLRVLRRDLVRLLVEELTCTTLGSSVARRVSSATAASRDLPTRLGTVTFGLPLETRIVTIDPRGCFVRLLRVLLVDVARLDVCVRQPPHVVLEAVRVDQRDGLLLEDARVEVDRDRLVRVDLVADVVVRSQPPIPSAIAAAAATSHGHHGPAGLDLALVRRGSARRRRSRPVSGWTEVCRGRLAAEHHRRGLLRLRPHGVAPADELEVAVHLLGRAVAVGGLLRERAQDDEVEVVRDLGPDRRRRRRHLREVLHRDLDRASRP